MTLPNLNTVFNKLKRHKGAVALDIETYDPDLKKLGSGVRRDGYIIGIAIALDNGRDKWYLPIAHDEGENLPKEKTLALLREWSRDFNDNLIGANLVGYDLDYLAEVNVTFPKAKVRDVLLAEPLIDETHFDYSLDGALYRHLGISKQLGDLPDIAARLGKTKAEQNKLRNNPQNILWRLPPEQVTDYALGDVEPLFDLLEIQENILASEDLNQVWELECRLMPVTLAMTRRGVRVDLLKAEEARRKIQAQRDQIIAELSKRSGCEIKLWIAETLAAALETEGHELPRTPKTNKPSITSTWLETASGEIPEMIRRARKLDKVDSTFLAGHIQSNAVNGRVHPRWHQLKSDDGGTITGRFSCSNPNLQQLSSRDAMLAEVVRGCFVPEVNESWLRDDLEQIEFKLLVHYARGAGADEARELYNNEPGTSFHLLAAELAKMDASDPAIYKVMKNTNFCKVYGGGARKVATTAGISYEDAVAFVQRYDRRLPFVKITNRKVAEVANERGWVKSLSGRKHRFVLWEPQDFDIAAVARKEGWSPKRHKEIMQNELRSRDLRADVQRYKAYKALNSVLQGGAADLMKEVMVRQMEQGIFDVLGPLLVTVHDEEGWSVPQTPAGKEAADEARDIFSQVGKDWGIRVPITTSREIGSSWGSVK